MTLVARLVRDAPMVAATGGNIPRHVGMVMAIQAQPGLFRLFKGHMTVLTFFFVFFVSLDDLSRHYHAVEKTQLSEQRCRPCGKAQQSEQNCCNPRHKSSQQCR